MSRRYKVLLTEDREAGGFVVTVPALPGCITEGDTVEEALANAVEAIQAALEGLRRTGQPVPDGDADIQPTDRTVAV
ncbi:MAG: type II toxin-antitoxin system HicB family antitoxin [Firmicutes bacterium]|nr:type II toxin-antitoxin system HicB family antitoxin [Bacillota bacterium]